MATDSANQPPTRHANHLRRRHHHDESITESIERILLPAITVFFVITLCIFYSADDPSPDFAGSSDEIQHITAFWSEKNPPSILRPDEMKGVGDKTSKYRALREEFDAIFPIDATKAHKATVQSLHKRKYSPMESDIGYNIHNCPLNPPDGYPFTYNLVSEILANWPADDTTPRPNIYQTLCVFDYETEYEKAENYRNAELPFIVRNDPQVLRTAARWSHPQYLRRLLKDEPHRAEFSLNNHFMYWSAPRHNPKQNRHKDLRAGKKVIPRGWEEPTKMITMTYDEWLSRADVPDENLGPENPHWYFRLIGCGTGLREKQCDKFSSESLFDELPFFQPKPNLYMVLPEKQKGIHCRFGMKGVIAENHFDGMRNAIALLGGERRYILAHPEECPHLALLPKEHPSGRHSAVDWSDPDLEKFPEFKEAMGNEVVLQAGDVLYLPTDWFHYIISLELNFQCNTRSGISGYYRKYLKECGFY